MKSIRQHINELFRNIPESERKKVVQQEIIENLEEKVFDLMAQGKNEEDAVNKTIVEFGDIEEIRKELIDIPNTSPRKKRARLNLGFSLWGSGMIIALLVFANFYYTPDVIWFVYPTFAVLWWPLSLFFYWLRQKD